MNTTTAAHTAGVTPGTIASWCRKGVIAAVKQAGRWVIDTASLIRRVALGTLKTRKEHTVTQPQPDAASASHLVSEININIAQAAEVGSIPALQRLLARIEAHDIAEFVKPDGVYPTQQQWDDCAAYAKGVIGNMHGEARTAAAIYDND